MAGLRTLLSLLVVGLSTLCLGALVTILAFTSSGTAQPAGAGRPRPHIVFIVADDLGWNDVGYNNPDILTPNINQLAESGIIFNQSYMQPLCTPSRSSFMTGYFPFRIGLQHGAFLPNQPQCAAPGFTFLPQELKKLGYSTHAVGKWHLGFCNWNCTPTYRGFDSFYGFYQGQEDYYTYDLQNGKDFRNNTDFVYDQNGTYASYVYQNYLRGLISNYNPDTPLFLYLPLQFPHTPLQAPDVYTSLYPNLKTDNRRIFSGMVTAMDDIIGNLTSFIKDRGMYDDTLFFFTSDNGGWAQFGGNNYPLRGGKLSVWEGGTRVPGFVHGHRLHSTGVRYNGMMHAVDWFPTIISAAGGQVTDNDMDGVNMWDAIKSQSTSPRSSFVYNIDNLCPTIGGQVAIREGDYKLMYGYPGLYNDWYLPDEEYNGQNDIGRAAFELGGPNPIIRLYNIKDDPTEQNDLVLQEPEVTKALMARLQQYMTQYVPPVFPPNDPNSNPSRYNGVWTPGWCTI